MKIKAILEKVRPSFSFEFFPPKDSEGFEQLFTTIGQLESCQPTYVSVTFGAGGSTRAQTIDLVGRIKNEIGLESMAHLTCVGSSQEELRSILDTLQEKGIENILALRGDPPQGQEKFEKPENGFAYANELVEFIRKHYDFCIGVAGYPEGHVECPDKNTDLENLKEKWMPGRILLSRNCFSITAFILILWNGHEMSESRFRLFPGSCLF